MAIREPFKAWWHALAAVPANGTETDWWAKDDGRYPRYQRLFRVWSDTSDGWPPPFYRFGREKNLVPSLWENFSLFSPGSMVKGLYSALRFKDGDGAVDLAWSYEFQLGHGDRHLDIVIHVRFADRDEIILVEAKAPARRFDAKDLQPENVLDRGHFQEPVANRRRYFLLGDGEVPVSWLLGDHGVLRWDQLLSLQLDLCNSMDEEQKVVELVKAVLAIQFGLNGIGSGSTISVRDLEQRIEATIPNIRSAHVRAFVRSAVQHVRCLKGDQPSAIPFDYLRCEPTVGNIRTGWRPGCGGMDVNAKQYWRLPPRPTQPVTASGS